MLISKEMNIDWNESLYFSNTCDPTKKNTLAFNDRLIDIVVNWENSLLWGKYKIIKELAWWLTNKVYLAKNSDWNNVVIKQWDELKRELEFYWFISDNNISGFPKLIESIGDASKLIFEFKEWVNWKEIVDLLSEKNWYLIWKQLWESINNLHNINIKLTSEEKNYQ